MSRSYTTSLIAAIAMAGNGVAAHMHTITRTAT